MLISYTQTLLVSMFLLMLFCLPLGAWAVETASTSGTSTASSTKQITTPTPPIPAVTDNMRAKLQPLAQTRITNLAANLSNRLDATVHRLENVSVRLDSRLTKMKESGLDTSVATFTLVKANDELAAAKKTLSTIDIEVTSFVGSENPIAAWARLETIYRTIIKNVLTAHAALGSTLTTLENSAPISAPETASSTITQ